MPIEILTALPIKFMAYFGLGLFAMAEGPVATLMGGAASSSGALLPVPVYVSVVLGNLTADMGWYGLGRFSKPEWLTRLAPRLGFDPHRVQQLTHGIQRHAPRLLFISKLTVGFPIPTLIATGISRVPVRRWMGMLVLGELIKSAALVTVGYLFARAVGQASAGVQVVLWSITAAAVIGGVIRLKKHGRK